MCLLTLSTVLTKYGTPSPYSRSPHYSGEEETRKILLRSPWSLPATVVLCVAVVAAAAAAVGLGFPSFAARCSVRSPSAFSAHLHLHLLRLLRLRLTFDFSTTISLLFFLLFSSLLLLLILFFILSTYSFRLIISIINPDRALSHARHSPTSQRSPNSLSTTTDGVRALTSHPSITTHAPDASSLTGKGLLFSLRIYLYGVRTCCFYFSSLLLTFTALSSEQLVGPTGFSCLNFCRFHLLRKSTKRTTLAQIILLPSSPPLTRN